MTAVEIENALDSLQILIDTREQETRALKKRIEGFNCPSQRYKLDYGDYTGMYIDSNGNEQDMSNIAVIERKMNLSEICTNFTAGRSRFAREFERARKANCRIHIIVEGDSYENLFAGNYRSKLNPNALIASLLSWSARYNLQLHFCKPETTGRLIHDILYYALREHLLSQEV